MVGCNWCGTIEVKLAENKPYCPDCASNCKRECTLCHKPYPNLKFYEKHSKRRNSCQSRNLVAKTKKASMENNRRKFGVTTGKRNNMTVMKNPPLLEEKRRRRRNMKLKTIALIEESLKKKSAQMRPPVKLRTFKKLLFHLQKDN